MSFLSALYAIVAAPFKLPWSEVKARFQTVFINADKHEIFVMAAALAYATALALAPFMLIVLSVASLLPSDLQQNIYQGLNSAVGEKIATTIISMIKNAESHSDLSTFSAVSGVLVLAVSASIIFTNLQIALDKINEHAFAKDPVGFWIFIKSKLFTIGLVFGFSFLLVASLVFTMLIAIFYPQGVGFFWQLISFMINFTLFSLVFTAIYRFVPTDKAKWKNCIVSGVISAIFYLVGKSIIGLYLSKAGLESSYGAAGSLIVLLVWVYYTALTLLFSYEFTRDVILKQDMTTEKKIET